MNVLNIVRQQGGDKLEDIALGGFQKIINQEIQNHLSI